MSLNSFIEISFLLWIFSYSVFVFVDTGGKKCLGFFSSSFCRRSQQPYQKNAFVSIVTKMYSKSGRASLVSVFCNIYQTIIQGRTCEQITCIKIYGKMFIFFF